MLTHPTEQRLIDLGLAGMAKALEEQRRLPDVAALSFEERLGLMVDREAISRNNKRLGNRLKFAGLRQAAVVEPLQLVIEARWRNLIAQHVRALDSKNSGACLMWPPSASRNGSD